MKAKLLNHINVGMLDRIGDSGHDLPDEEVTVLCGPFVSTIGNSPMLAWCLCETEEGKRFYIEATNLQMIKPTWDDWKKDLGKIFIQPVDWPSFRREAAKDFTVALVSSGSGLNPKTIAYAIEMSEELIEQLRKKKNETQ